MRVVKEYASSDSIWRRVQMKKFAGEKEIQLMVLVQCTADLQLRRHFKLPLIGDDGEIDSQLKKAVHGFFNSAQKDQSSQSSASEHEYTQWLENDLESKCNRKIYFRAYLCRQIKGDSPINVRAIDEMCSDANTESLEDFKINDILLEKQKILRTIERELKLVRKRLVDFSLANVTSSIPWFSVFAIIAGFVPTRIVFYYFGIDSSSFFSIGDYFASSIEQIKVPAVVGVLLFMIVVVWDYRKSNLRAQYAINIARRLSIGMTGLAIFSLLIYQFLFIQSLNPYVALPSFLIALTLVLFWGNVKSRKLCKHPRIAFLTLCYVAIFVVTISFSAQYSISKIERGCTEVTFALNSDAGSKSVRKMIGANSQYIFLQSEKVQSEEESVQVIPTENLKYLIPSTNSSWDCKWWNIPWWFRGPPLKLQPKPK